MKNEVLLTVAIPVYNVDKYLRRCIDSILTNKIDNYEILLVDDGSKDKSGVICDEYANQYDFIRVIHKKNSGLADVRNICIKEAKGEFVSFVDSDDYLSNNAYSNLMKIQKEYNADIVCFGVNDIYDGIDNKIDSLKNEEIKCFTNKEALSLMLLPGYIDVITCNKIIRKSLFDNIEYPVGKLYEDMFTNYKVVYKPKE